MLVRHSKTAQSMGIPPENMQIINNGDVVELTENSIRIANRVPSGIELVDSSRSGVVKDSVLQERKQLAVDGVVTVAVAIGWDGAVAAKPELHLRGVVTSIEPEELQTKVTEAIESVLYKSWSEFAAFLEDGNIEVNWKGLRQQFERELKRLLRRQIQGNPSLVFLMQTPQEPPAVFQAKERHYSRSATRARVAF